jgi:hypothetical protein
MVDCRWNDPKTPPATDAFVSLGQKFVLLSGLVEITYDTGAKVILQGPVTYEVESNNGGYLAVGKLTAKLEKGPKSKVQGPKSDLATSHQPLATGLFAIRTPSAIVTDLGTEFGVEVNKQGSTTSHVFRGSVELRTLSTDKNAKPIARVLRVNESAMVEYDADRNSGNPVILTAPSLKPSDFVREISKQPAKPSEHFEVVAFWRFDGKDFLVDSSDHGHTLVNSGATQIDGTAMFNGKGMMHTVNSIDLTPYRKIRVSWSQRVLDTAEQLVWENTDNYNEHVGAVCCEIGSPLFTDGKASLCLRTRGGFNVDQYDVSPGVWESIAVEYRIAGNDRNGALSRTEIVKVFKNGVPVGQGTQFEDSNPADSFVSAVFNIGGRLGRGISSSGFRGQIDDLKIEGVRTMPSQPTTQSDNHQ